MDSGEQGNLSGYIVREKLGTGAASRVYRVEQPGTGRMFALKRVIKQKEGDERFLEQVVVEYEVSRRINDDRVRRVYDLKKIRKMLRLNEVHLIMELVQGLPLDIRRVSTMPDIIHVFREIAEGLGAMHRSGMIHADMKPNNVMVDSTGKVKIIDLGQGCAIGTRKERVQGTPDYIAPEQVARMALDERTDVFNFGASLYWVLTDRPFPTVITVSNEKKPVKQSLSVAKTAVPPHEIRADVPPGMSKLIMDCCASNPAHRPRNMKQVIARLDMVTRLIHRAKQSLDTSFGFALGGHGELEGTGSSQEVANLPLGLIDEPSVVGMDSMRPTTTTSSDDAPMVRRPGY